MCSGVQPYLLANTTAANAEMRSSKSFIVRVKVGYWKVGSWKERGSRSMMVKGKCFEDVVTVARGRKHKFSSHLCPGGVEVNALASEAEPGK